MEDLITSKGLKNFYALEGGEGSGKSTALKLLSAMLDKAGIDHITTREPGGTIDAEEIRNVIMRKEYDNTTEALLFAASRRVHLEQKIIPALNKGEVVITDRYVFSSIVYQLDGESLTSSKT